MKLIILCKGSLESQPPIMSVAMASVDLGHTVRIITSHSEKSTKEIFFSKGICIVDVFPSTKTITFISFINKLRHWLIFSKKSWGLIYAQEDFDLLWIGTADTALALGEKLLKHQYVLHILELYDRVPIYRFLLKKFARAAKNVVVPEMCRAAIFRSWYGLTQTPIVLPNKMIDHPVQRNLQIINEVAKDALAQIGSNERIVLYQGHIGRDRELLPVAEAINDLGEQWRFVVMGPVHGNYLDVLKAKCKRLIWIPPVLAPLHLQITSHAYIGVIQYSYDVLNNVFCAPNKIWEYSGFGLPIICNDLPPLNNSIQKTGAGLCVAAWDNISISKALVKIDQNHDSFSNASRIFFDSVNFNEIMNFALRD